ncbi:MAG: SIMPL domain-containing protein [Candidatus Hydrogenedentales bacterium]|jgi:uncharacterized protein YggE
MTTARILGFTAVALLAGCVCVHAQATTPPTTIESTGVATLDMTPDFADFTFMRSVAADTAEAALKQVDPFAASLEEELKKRELAYRELTAAGPTIVDHDNSKLSSEASQEKSTAQVTVTARFALGTFQTSQTGQAEFGALCDKLKTLAKEMDCAFGKPAFAVADVKSAEATALGTAVENAYGWGEGVARVLAAVITSVENVRIVEVKWSEEGELKRLSCTATVVVKYTAVPSQP